MKGKDSELGDYVDEDLCTEELTEAEIARFKGLAERKRLPNLMMTGVYDARDILQEELEKEGAEDAYEISRGKGAKILIVNSGADRYHPEIADGFIDGINYHEKNKDVSDKCGHGTHIVGIIAGKTMGIAPFSNYYVAKVRDDREGMSPTIHIRRALVEWMDEDIDIINISIGKIEYDEDLEKFCKLIHYRKGKLIVSGAGKTKFGPTFPSSCEGVISVAAVDKSGQHRESSNIWPSVDISAPGEEIFTAGINKKDDYELAYVTGDGTSMAAPHVTGILASAIAYLKKKKVKYDIEKLELLMKTSAVPSEYSKKKIDKMIEKYSHHFKDNNIYPALFVKYMYGTGTLRADNFVKEVIRYAKYK